MNWQVCDLKYSKKLAKLGVKQKSQWWWMLPLRYGAKWELKLYKELPQSFQDKRPRVKNRYYPAFTVAELGKRLPPLYISMQVKKGQKLRWCVCPKIVADERAGWNDKRIFRANTEANVRARCLIYLKEKRLIK